LRILSQEISGPRQLITRINQWLCRNIPVTNFITLTCVAVEPNSNCSSKLSYTNAGHFPPILVREDGKVERLEPNGGVLGVHEGFDYGEGNLALNSKDLLLLYTDGVTESRNPQGELFGDEKLIDFVCRHKSEPLASLLDTLLKEVQQFSGKLELDDDLTVIALRKL
jgi:sigma-B regulation protein RsbU (phosphoserine phosphatase)